MGNSANYGISAENISNLHGIIAVGPHASARVGASSGSDPARLIEQLRALFAEHADDISPEQLYGAMGAIEEIRDQLQVESPKRSRMASALDVLKSSAGSAVALLSAVSDLSAAIDHLPR